MNSIQTKGQVWLILLASILGCAVFAYFTWQNTFAPFLSPAELEILGWAFVFLITLSLTSMFFVIVYQTWCALFIQKDERSNHRG